MNAIVKIKTKSLDPVLKWIVGRSKDMYNQNELYSLAEQKYDIKIRKSWHKSKQQYSNSKFRNISNRDWKKIELPSHWFL